MIQSVAGSNRPSASHGLRIFVISLKRRADRSAHMRVLLAARGLTAELVEAVDGRALTDEQKARYHRERALAVYGAEMNAAEIGCHLSHMSVYRRMVDEGIETALVLEDDIDCDADFAAVLDSVMASPRRDWLVLRLQSTKDEVINASRAATQGDRAEVFHGRTMSRVRTGVLGGCGYLIRQQGAQRMLRYAHRPFMPIDQTLDRYWENGIEPYVLRPFPVRQNPRIASEIAERKVKAALSPRLTAVRRTRRALDGVRKRIFAMVSMEGWRRFAVLPRLTAPGHAWRPAASPANG